MPKLTSDLATGNDPTVAGQAVPLLSRDADGNEIDWRKKYICTCTPGVELTDDALCDGCKGLTELLRRLRADRRMRQAAPRKASTSPTSPAKSRRRSHEDELR